MISRRFLASRNRGNPHGQVMDVALSGSTKSWARPFAAAVFIVAVACSGSSKPRVEVMENGVYMRKAVSAYAISGARDGTTTRAVAMITMDDGEHVRIELEVTYNPTPELASGHWQREGKVAEEGQVHAESLKFLGGQGSTPSVGGRFRLETNGNPRLRVILPTQPLARPSP